MNISVFVIYSLTFAVFNVFIMMSPLKGNIQVYDVY